MLVTILKFFIKKLFRVRVKGNYQGGQANGSDKTLIVANHSSFLDGILLLLFLPEAPLFVIHKESERSCLYRFFLRFVDYIGVDTSNPMPMRKVIHHINSGRPVVIFPEGRVTVSGSLMKLYSGAAFAALKTGATLVPIHINGTKPTYLGRLDKLLSLKLLPKVTVTIFPPTDLSATDRGAIRDTKLSVGREEMHRLMMNMAVEARERHTLFDMLVDAQHTFGKNRLAYRDNLSDDLSYGSLVTKSVSLSILLQRKVQLSRRVGLLLPNANACILAFYALQHAGKTPVMINYTAGERAVTAGLIAAEVKTILTSRRFIEKGELQPLIEALSDYDIVYLEDLRSQVTLADKLTIAVKRMVPTVTAAKQSPDDEALVLFTSGTEGLPKGVLHSHDGLMTQIAQIKAIYDFNSHDNFMLCLPVFHVFGLMGGFALPISVGASGFLYPSPLHYKAIPELVYENGCTVLLSTSTFLAGYARFAEAYDFHSLRYVIAGAEKLSAEVNKIYIEKFGIRIMEGYGATETAPVISAETTMLHNRGSVGRLLPGMTAELVPVEGIENGGKLVVHADNVMLGYLRADNPGVVEKLPLASNGKRVYDTGDIAEVDQYGFIHLKGRIKRFAKIAGEMVSLETVEKMAQHASPDGHHASIIFSDSKKGEAICLFTTDTALNRKQLQQASKELGIPKLAVPKSIEVVEEIPVFSSGKTNYPALTELYQSIEQAGSKAPIQRKNNATAAATASAGQQDSREKSHSDAER